MSTTAEKLTYLNTTKQKIKDAINNIGGNITSETTFRQYVAALESIYQSMPKVSGTGTSLSLSPTLKGLMQSTLKGNTSQVQLSGKNLIYTSPRTNNGITFAYNSNTGETTISGQASGTYAIAKEIQCNIPAGTYTLSLQSTRNFAVGIGMRVDGGARQVKVIFQNSTSNTFTTTGTITSYDVYITELTLGTQYNATFKLMLESGSTQTSFEPYVGGVPSPNPSYPQDIHNVSGDNDIVICGKNLFDKNAISNNTWLLQNGDIEAHNDFCTSDYIRVDELQNYYLPKTNTRRLKYYNSSKQALTNDWDITSGSDNQVITIPTNAYYVRITIQYNAVDINTYQFEKGNQPTTYEAYNGTTYPINLPSGMELCKIGTYQDYIYKENDKWYLHKEIGKVVLSNCNWIQETTANSRRYGTEDIKNIVKKPPNNVTTMDLLSNIYIKNNASWSWNTTSGKGICIQTNGAIIVYDDNYTASTDLSNFTTMLSNTNAILEYPLATPTNTEITDTTLISQLEAIYNAKSKNGTTNINQENNDLPFILDVSALLGSGS